MTKYDYPEGIHLYKILYLGFDAVGKVDVPSSIGHIIWFDKQSYHAYATIQHKLASAFFSVELLSQTGYNKPFTIDIFVPRQGLRKYKVPDPETCIERIHKWILRMEPTKCPLIVKIYSYDNSKEFPQFGNSDNFNCLWPLKNTETKKRNYITYQPYENWDGDEDKWPRATRYTDGYLIQDIIIEEADELGIEVIKIDYTTPFEDAVSKISASRGHFSYFGGSYFIAAALNINSYIFGYLKPHQRKPINHIDGSFLPSPWTGNKVTQFNISSRKIFTSPVTHFSFLNTASDVKERIKECYQLKKQ